jgi:hypothetical protein
MFYLVKGTNYEKHHVIFLLLPCRSKCSSSWGFVLKALVSIIFTWCGRRSFMPMQNAHLFLPHALFAPCLLKCLSFLLRPVLLMKLSAVLEVIELVLCGVAVSNLDRHMKSHVKFPLCLNSRDAATTP